ncbi:AAA family ATPase [Arthrobacter echini]|uniref:AAA family ATPase n=1 Tax=Arthrobacter echini TaxID=1529066 RepID=A0A4V3Z634_9MICC|nr:AAA family ATPase [Arthrobacter echini]THJ67849.1 AAA family ATPase [Arthrobacter echini]
MIAPAFGEDLVGRAGLVSEIIVALRDTSGFGALLVGEAGVGKTAVARAVLEQLDWSAPVLPLRGDSALRSVPYGAFAPYLRNLSPGEDDSPVAVLRAVMAQLARGRATRGERHPPLIVVDDAHDLDGSSSTLLAQLISARRARVLVIMRDSSPASTEFRSLSTDNLLTRFNLAPLELEEVRALCERVLGGPVLTGTAHTLAVATGGNPKLLRTVLGHGEAQGYLTQVAQVWRLNSDTPVLHPQLVDLVGARLRSRSDMEKAVLEFVALVEPATVEVLARHVDGEVLTHLLNERLIVVGQEPHRTVSVNPPLYADVLASQAPTARTISLRRTFIEALPPAPESPERTVQRFSWRLAGGAATDDRTLLGVADIANGLRDHTLALRAARAVSASALRGRALVETARAHFGRKNAVHARDLVDEALRDCRDLHVAKHGILVSFELRVRAASSHEDLRRDVAHWKSLISAIESLPRTDRTPEDYVRARLGCAILECRVRLLEGQLEELEEDLRTLLSHPDGTAESRVACMVLLGDLLGTLGRTDEGSTYTLRSLKDIETGGASLLAYREVAVERHVLLLTNSGRLDEAIALLDECLRAYPLSATYYGAWTDFVDGTRALRSVRNREARDRFLLAREGLKECGDTQSVPLVTAMAAYACALVGETDSALSLIGELDRSPSSTSQAVRTASAIYATATMDLLPNTTRTGADLLTLAAQAERDHMKALASTALQLLVLIGNTNALDPLVALLPDVEGADARILLEFARAAKARDGDAMLGAASAAAGIGNVALEFAALSLAHQSLDEQGSRRRAQETRRRLVMLGEQRQGPVPSPFVSAYPSATAPRLTPTERSIVDLVREGYSNRDIADSKGVSVRTVEGHLYRIFAKFGVNRREDLREP